MCLFLPIICPLFLTPSTLLFFIGSSTYCIIHNIFALYVQTRMEALLFTFYLGFLITVRYIGCFFLCFSCPSASEYSFASYCLFYVQCQSRHCGFFPTLIIFLRKRGPRLHWYRYRFSVICLSDHCNGVLLFRFNYSKKQCCGAVPFWPGSGSS